MIRNLPRPMKIALLVAPLSVSLLTLSTNTAFAEARCVTDVDFSETDVVTSVGAPVAVTGRNGGTSADAVTDTTFDLFPDILGTTDDLSEAISVEAIPLIGDADLSSTTETFVQTLPNPVNVVNAANVTTATAIATVTARFGEGADGALNESFANGGDAFACGPDATALGENATAVGNDAIANGENATAVGADSNAQGENSSAFGQEATAGDTITGADDATAVGTLANATGNNSTAVGNDAQATGDNATAIGEETVASGDNATAIGQDAQATGDNSTAVGQDAQANGISSLAVGQSSSATGTNAVAVGQNASATDTNATAVGNDATSGENGVAVGNFSDADENGVAVGNFSEANENGTAVGNFSNAIGENSIAVGNGADANGTGSTATGANSLADSDNSTAVGANTSANAEGSVAVGTDSGGNGAQANLENQFVLGTENHTYTAPGITSGLSRDRQAGPLEVVTTDADGNLASDGGQIFRELGELGAGIAIATALENPDLVGGETFGISANFGFFEGSTAMALSAIGVLGHDFMGGGERWAISGGVGVSLNENEFGGQNTNRTIGGRAGVQVTW